MAMQFVFLVTPYNTKRTPRQVESPREILGIADEAGVTDLTIVERNRWCSKLRMPEMAAA
jgi:hypothetical protein